MMRSSCLLILGLLGLPLAACGGGGGDDLGEPPVPVAVSLVSDGPQDGYVGYTDPVTPRTRNLVNSIGVGDNDAFSTRRSTRGFLGFDLRGLPAGAEVISATLQVYQSSVVGSPYATLGEIRVDHVDYGATLDYDDYGIPPLVSSTEGLISSDTALEWKQLDVTSQVSADLRAGRTRSQFRLRFDIAFDDDGVNDWALFEDGEMSQGTTNPPRLAIEFVVP